MQGYIRMKIDYLKRSKERIRELESDIECLCKRVPSIEKGAPERRIRREIDRLRNEVKELELNIGEMAVSDSDSWEWTLEIEDTEWLFKVLREHINQAKTGLEENKGEGLASEDSELTKTKTKG